ncbi:hypothetical protein DFQ28_001576 [Apophysomyces sp. BC1034]|nr:hypothetical protein DFQ28_001576 [Apophysomyces sp. BC1034]
MFLRSIGITRSPWAKFYSTKTNEFRGASLVRTRDEAKLTECDVVVDVGGVYDPQRRRFDHHQAGFKETFHKKSAIKLSSAGLIYK